MALDDEACRGRVLAAALEPFVGSVYFAPEAHAAYHELGFAPSPGPWPADDPWGSDHWGGVAMTPGPAYMASRGSLLGQVPGEVVAAAFGVFAPQAVAGAVALGWSRTDAATIRAARARGAPSSPQEATMTGAVQDWVRGRGLAEFPGVPDRPDPGYTVGATR